MHGTSEGENYARAFYICCTHPRSGARRGAVIYVSIVNCVSMESAREVEAGKTMLVIAAWVDELRMVDDVVL